MVPPAALYWKCQKLRSEQIEFGPPMSRYLSRPIRAQLLVLLLVCMSDWLFASISKKDVRTSAIFSTHVPRWQRLDPPLAVLRYITYTSGFVDGVVLHIMASIVVATRKGVTPYVNLLSSGQRIRLFAVVLARLWRKCIVVTVHAGKRGGVISR